MATNDIIHVTNQKIPSIIAFDPINNKKIFGSSARAIGFTGNTNICNFKPDVGLPDKTFSELKKYWYYYKSVDDKGSPLSSTFSTKEVTKLFLEELLNDTHKPEKLIIGEPAIRDENWKEYYRRHMREILNELGHKSVEFFPEPFAVFQYYRHIKKIFPASSESQNVLIIDIGGGTFNSCIIRTTSQGMLARRGATAIPLGLQAEICGGTMVDQMLLECAVEKAKSINNIAWKEDPIRRVSQSTKKVSAFLTIEDAKISLSNQIGTERKIADDVSFLEHDLYFEVGTLHATEEIHVKLNGEDLKKVIRNIWRKNWGEILFKTINEARDKSIFTKELDQLDIVLIAGGSSMLPYFKEEVSLALVNKIKTDKIFIGNDAGTAVALGIAAECREQFNRDPKLAVGKIAPCLLNDLFIGVKRNKQDGYTIPKVRFEGKLNKNGQLLSSPFETNEYTINYELELPFAPSDRLYYSFFDRLIDDDCSETTSLNPMDYVFSLGNKNKYERKFDLQIKYKPDGTITPIFILHEKISGSKSLAKSILCQDFIVTNFDVVDGDSFCGIDFGTSNSYVSRFIARDKPLNNDTYPELSIQTATRSKLHELELYIEKIKGSNFLSIENILDYSLKRSLSIVFHSNKIEGNPLTKGETEEAILNSNQSSSMNKNQQEAINMDTAYKWILENFKFIKSEPLNFTRELNKILRKGIDDDAGTYRKSKVAISGVEFSPPPASEINYLMEQLSNDIKGWKDGRSAIEFACSIHTKLVWIHPFTDGNGRTARLIFNAILLNENLPCLVVNFADKTRYLLGLEESNKGDLSSLVEFFIEIMTDDLRNIENDFFNDNKENTNLVKCDEIIGIDLLDNAIESAIGDLENDLLFRVLEETSDAYILKNKAIYDATANGFNSVIMEAEAISIMINENPKYKASGFSLSIKNYDMVDYDKYINLLTSESFANSWLSEILLTGAGAAERILLAIGKVTIGNMNCIAINFLRHNGIEYKPFSSEPITLRHITYSSGELISFDKNSAKIDMPLRIVLRNFFAEIIMTYIGKNTKK